MNVETHWISTLQCQFLNILNNAVSSILQVSGFNLPEPVGDLYGCKKLQHCMYFLQQLRKLNLPQELLIQFYSAGTESVHISSDIAVSFVSATKSDKNRLQQTVKTTEIKIISAPLPVLVTCRVRKRQNHLTHQSFLLRKNLFYKQLPVPSKVSWQSNTFIFCEIWKLILDVYWPMCEISTILSFSVFLT